MAQLHRRDNGARIIEEDMLLEDILSKENARAACKRVIQNKGCAGIDGMGIEELKPMLNETWAFLKAEILEGSYQPKPVKRVEIPKPGGGTRKLGIPTVLDRFIQQAISQLLTKRCDSKFSESSYGYRPNRRAQGAVMQAQKYLSEGYVHVVEIDIAKFFDAVQHDFLMHVLSEQIEDKRVLKLIRKYLQAGVQMGDIVKPNEQGTPQGGPISPILSNIVLDKLDKELEKRGHRFVRYADDICIFVRSERAGKRVLESIGKFLKVKLKLTVNAEKSGVKRPHQAKLLGFKFSRSKDGAYEIRIHQESIETVKRKVREITNKNKPMKLENRIKGLNRLIAGWMNYFKIADGKWDLGSLDSWCRSKLRYCIWVTWKLVRTRIRELKKLGMAHRDAVKCGCTRRGGWRVCHTFILCTTLTNRYMREKVGYIGFEEVYLK